MAETEDAEAGMRAAAKRDRWDVVATLVLRAYGQELLEYLIATARSEGDGNDAFSVFTERMWRGLPKFRWESTVRTWCYTVARRALAEVKRTAPARRAKLHAPLSQTPELAALAADVRTRTVSFLRTAARDALAEVRDGLDPEDRELLILRVDRKLGWREVARILSEDEDLGAAALERRSAALRKRFEKLKEKLRIAVERTRSS
jgi:RNA polymerase sigma-70 factor (ECF subfamily)